MRQVVLSICGRCACRYAAIEAIVGYWTGQVVYLLDR
jgi:hypothetical protein